jgi:hypothetical protein
VRTVLLQGDIAWPCPGGTSDNSFAWQIKYGAFGVSVSLLDKTVQYIQTQEEHHRKMTFQEEFLVLLKRHRIAYNERYLWE